MGRTKPSRGNWASRAQHITADTPRHTPQFLKQLVLRNKSLPKHKACQSVRGKGNQTGYVISGSNPISFSFKPSQWKFSLRGWTSRPAAAGQPPPAQHRLPANLRRHCLHLPKAYMQTLLSPCRLATHPNQTHEKSRLFPPYSNFHPGSVYGTLVSSSAMPLPLKKKPSRFAALSALGSVRRRTALELLRNQKVPFVFPPSFSEQTSRLSDAHKLLFHYLMTQTRGIKLLKRRTFS